jgi:hypothetical protein
VRGGSTLAAVPDWTYLPLRRAAERVVGVQRSRRGALILVSGLARLPGGATIIRGFDFTHRHEAAAVVFDGHEYDSPCGLVVDRATPGRVRALQAMGFGFVVEPHAVPTGAVTPSSTAFTELVALARQRVPVVLNAAVVEHGPTLAQRINEVLASDERSPSAPPTVDWLRPWTWHGWVWAMWLGIAMVCAGIGASVVAVGPVLLGYDRRFLRVDRSGLDALNARLIPFLRHDRITLAGCMVAIGVNDIALASAMRQGWRWACAAFTACGAIGFPTFFLFLGYRFLDPLHLAVAVGFFPLYLMGVFGTMAPPTWRAPTDVDELLHRRASVAQLLMVLLTLGVTLSGFAIMIVGLGDVLIPSDLVYLHGSQQTFESALDGRLLRFVAHDRAGFGGALASLGVGVLTMVLWGWRSGQRSTQWGLGLASAVGFGAALAVHFSVGYTDSLHLLPVYLGAVMLAVALWLTRQWFRSAA